MRGVTHGTGRTDGTRLYGGDRLRVSGSRRRQRRSAGGRGRRGADRNGQRPDARQKKYEAVQELALRAQAQADALRKRLLAAMEQDTQAFLQVSAAYAMPKQTPEEKQARSSAIEQGLKACTQPPLAVMQLCAEGLELLESLLGKTNATAASDFGVACLSLRAGMQGAWLNVCINTGSLHDAAFAAGARAAGQKLLDTGLPRADRCYAAMLAACSEK